MSLQLPKVIGHRGAKNHAPENTFAGLREAVTQGATWVEVDVMLSRDKVAFLHHDETLARTAGLDAPAGETDWAEIEKLDAGAWFGPEFEHILVPRLDRAIPAMLERGLGCNFEIKPTKGREGLTAEIALPIIQDLWPASAPTPVISSFKRESLAVSKEIAPELPRGLLVEELPEDWLASARALECLSIHPWWETLTQDQVAAMKTEGFLVAVYTCNDPEAAKRLIEWGADSIITDSPRMMIEALD